MLRSLVGSEMCIRDRYSPYLHIQSGIQLPRQKGMSCLFFFPTGRSLSSPVHGITGYRLQGKKQKGDNTITTNAHSHHQQQHQHRYHQHHLRKLWPKKLAPPEAPSQKTFSHFWRNFPGIFKRVSTKWFTPGTIYSLRYQ